jgi:Trans-aconitate methyltransferase
MSKLWEYYGSHDPYYGVLSVPEFRTEHMTEEARARFFNSGIEDVNQCIAHAEAAFGPLTFGTALDYGCGVGRLSRSLSDRFTNVISVDISESMLATARANLAGRNVRFENAAQMSDGPTNFILSQMVFQHIEPQVGLSILPKLAARLHGTGIIEIPIRDKSGVARRALRSIRGSLKAITRAGQPIIPMYAYDLDAVSRVLQSAGCRLNIGHFHTEMFENVRVVFHRA